MDRRDFVKTALAGMASSSLIGRSALAAPIKFYRGFRSAPDQGYPRRPLRLIEGKVPEDLQGTFYLNGPAKYDRGPSHYTHWFDGDGMIHAFRLGPDKATHEGRFVETPKFKSEREAGRLLYPAFGTVPQDPAPVMGTDDVNAANISILPVDDQLWALWEGGNAIAVDPDDLATEGFVRLSEGLAGVPFSAHPRVDQSGRIWNIGNSALTGQLVCYQLAPNGKLEKFKILSGLPKSMIHDFVTTERHMVVGFAPYLMTGHDGAYGDRFRWDGDKPRTYIVIDKETFEIVRRHDVPASWVFHYFNGWEERDGTIRFAACAYANADWFETEARNVAKGVPFSGTHKPAFESLVLYADGRSEVTQDDISAEFPQSDHRHADRPSASYHIGHADQENVLANGLFARDESGAVTAQWGAENDTLMGEHITIPRDGAGVWLIGVQFDARRGKTLLSLFDGNEVGSGPRALWALPDTIPVPLHGCWVPG